MTIISIEGIDGAGKTTLIHQLADKLHADGHAVTTVALPTPHGRTEAARYKPGWAQAFAYAADMADAWETTVLPAHKAGHVVLLDRGPTSTAVYQGRHIGDQEADNLAWDAVRHELPHLTLLLDAPITLAAHRQQFRGRQEQSDGELSELRDRYYRLAPWTTRRLEVIEVSPDNAVACSGVEAWRVVSDFLHNQPL